MTLTIGSRIKIPSDEIELRAIRAQGAGGQNVNKVSTAIHLRFDSQQSSLPSTLKEKIRKLSDRRVSADGVIVIKAQRFRSQEKNRADALERLRSVILKATTSKKTRVPTKASRASKRRRVDNKTRRGQLKNLRKKVTT